MAGVLYYISGHGFGHARRCAETIRVLNELRGDLPIHVRTMAEASIFRGLNVRFEQIPIDRGAVEIDAMNIDWGATLAGVRALIARKEAFVAREAAYIRDQRVSLIIADVPFMAGYVAHAAGVPCFAQCNFMWDWIYEPHTNDRQLLEAIRGGYRLMRRHLRLPFPHPCDHFADVVDVPFITSPLTLSSRQVREKMGIAPGDRRRVVLVGMRGGTSPEITAKLQAAEDDYLFITPSGPMFAAPIAGGSPLRFWDAMQIAEVVVSKPGHGIVTDCATMGVGLLYPARNGFREDPMILSAGSRFFRVEELPLSDYYSGTWKPHLDAMLQKPKPRRAENTGGTDFVARLILRYTDGDLP